MKRRRLIEILLLLSGGLLIIVLLIFFGRSVNEPSGEEQLAVIVEPNMEYGIVIDSLYIVRDQVKKNQFLSDILLHYGVDYQKIDQLVKRSEDIFDVRKIRAGNNYSVLCKNDSVKQPQYFVYEASHTDYIVFDLRDSVHVHKGHKEIETRLASASGVINSSLWESMVHRNTDPNLANELSEIYAWTIDFFGIQKGDFYKVIYEELYVDDNYIGIGKVYASLFNHMDNDQYAFYFVQDSTGDFFDEEANSLRRTFLKAPLRYKRISSGFSYNRLHPILKVRTPHTGVDYAADYGTPVHSVGDGVVIYARYKGPNGNLVKIKHNGTYTTAYLHLAKFGKGIKEGRHVKQGDIIGYVGSTGRATGPHLDFRFYRNGQPINPLQVESPPAEPVDSTHLEKFNLLVAKYMNELDTIPVGSEVPRMAGR
ncbi:MAG: peptidoglycan DD-metalloendopeptidase family protein [Bacteroidales bacterium]|nr:peptidoglycan DD-metalloendopeptidase family protein [Bacteroidales bacterium]